MRLVLFLAVAAAATVIVGALLMAASVVLRHVTRHPPVPPALLARTGLYVIAAGIAFGLVVLVLFAVGRLGRSRMPKPEANTPGRRQAAPRPQAAEPGGHARPAGHGAARSSRRPVVNPTHVYTPGGLIDVPRDGPAPGKPGGPPIPEILRTAGPGPNALVPGGLIPGGPGPGGLPGGRGQDRPPPGWAAPPPPRPGYQPGMSPPGPGRVPYGPGGVPGPTRDRTRQREAPRHGQPLPGQPLPGQPLPGQPMPGRQGMPGHQGMPRPEPVPNAGGPPRGAPPHQPQAPRPGPGGPMRDSGLFRDGGPREGMGPGGPAAPGRAGAGPLPPRDPAYPPPPGPAHGAAYGPGPGHGPAPGPGSRQGGAPGRHARGPGYAAAGARRPEAPYPEASEPDGEFDGGYAKVIRASDSPVRPARRPGPGRTARSPEPGRAPGEVPADVFVYRDTEDQLADAGRPPGPDDPSYWYDLAATGPAEETPQVPEETRGPFEPLVSSADPPGTARGAAPDPVAGPDAAAGAPGGEAAGDTVRAQARKLDQIKDLYLTAEAIGESNVDKHFDQLLAQQRELISDYFKQSPAAPGHGPGGQAESDRDIPAPAAGGSELPADPAEKTRVTADQPRVW